MPFVQKKNDNNMKITIEQLLNNMDKYSAGTKIELSGTIYTARDQAHKRLLEILNAGKTLPIQLKNACIYYCGPCPNAPDKIIGSCGPTTSSRMDVYTPAMLNNGVKILIGKGKRSSEVVNSIKENKAIYLLATGGVGALLAKKVKSFNLIAFEDLGPEAIYKIEVEDFPLTVGIDSIGKSLF
jgi:fumarate hydratase subunit beta